MIIWQLIKGGREPDLCEKRGRARRLNYHLPESIHLSRPLNSKIPIFSTYFSPRLQPQLQLAPVLTRSTPQPQPRHSNQQRNNPLSHPHRGMILDSSYGWDIAIQMLHHSANPVRWEPEPEEDINPAYHSANQPVGVMRIVQRYLRVIKEVLSWVVVVHVGA